MSHRLYLDVDVRNLPVGTRDVVFFVYRDDEKFGELRVSRGAVVWRGMGDKYGRKMSWRRFDALMQEHGRRSELRPPTARKSVRADDRR